MKIIGIDNGVTGSVGAVNPPFFSEVPTVSVQNYTKKKDNVTRLNVSGFKAMLEDLTEGIEPYDIMIVLERPLVNPGRFKATCSALRCMEAELAVIESLELPYKFIDSKEWQKFVLPKGTQGTAELKKASLDIGLRLFPFLTSEIKKHKDADGILIAYAESRTK